MASNQARDPAASPINGLVPPPEHRFVPGQSGNPSGRPRVDRYVTTAYAELQGTPGADPNEIIEAFTKARGARICGADFKAIAMFRAETNPDHARIVSAATEVTDRLEGKVAQRVEIGADAEITAAIAAAAKAARE
jgi:hypothetical protein